MDYSLLDRLPLDWASWTLENIIRGVSSKDICNILTKAGFADLAEELDRTSGLSDPNLAKRTVRSLITYREILLRKLKLRGLSNSEIARQPFDKKIFFENYYRSNEPVILTGLFDENSALSRWSPEYLKSAFGNLSVEVQRGREKDFDYELNLDKYRTRILLGEFVDLIQSSSPNNDGKRTPCPS